MASLGLRPPHFSEDVAWLPCWLQNLITDGSYEFENESQVPSKQAVKDLAPSQENGSDGKDISALSREGGYKSCHLFLSGEDSSLVSAAPSPGNEVFHFSLRLSSDVDSLSCPTQDLSASQDPVAPSKVLSLQPVETSIEFRENMHSITEHHACEQNLSPAFVPETVRRDSSKSSIDTIDSVRQQEEKSKVKCFKSADINDAIELSIAASEALVIHDLVKMGSVSETMRTEAVLEVAFRVKQARLEGLEDGFHSSNEESDWSDSLSDLNDFNMADAYEDVGLLFDVSVEQNLCNYSAISQPKGVFGAENYSGYNNKHSDKELTLQLANFDDNSEQKQLDVNLEMEMQQKTDSPLDSLFCERQTHSIDPGLGSNKANRFENGLPISHPLIQKSSNVLALNQTVGSAMVDLTSNKSQKSVNSSLVETSGNFKKENWATYSVPERFRSRWLGGWTCKELDSYSLDQNNAELIPKFIVRETSFLSESVDIVPDESSCVQKYDSKCAIGSQSSMPSEGVNNKADEGILHSQDVVRCSSLSLVDPLCSVVPCSISSEHANSKNQSDKKIDTENIFPAISEFEVDNFQRISNNNVAHNCRDEQIMSVLDEKDIPITVTRVDEQLPEKLTRVEHTCRKHLNSLKTYSMILPNQSLNLNCNLALLPTKQSMGGVASMGTRISNGLSAAKCAYGNENEENHEHFVDHQSIMEITDHKRSDDLKLKPVDVSDILAEPTQERRSPLILNHRTCRRLLGPKTAVNDIIVENHLKHHVVSETVEYQQNKCNNFHGGHVGVRKQVRFSETVQQLHRKRKFSKLEYSYKRCSSVKAKRQRVSKSLANSMPHMKHSLTNYCRRVVNEFIFQGTEFLLTGLSSQKERDMEALIRNSGGVVLSDIPSPPKPRGKRSSTSSRLQLPIILCMRKLQTTKFLYGCAVGASILQVDWLTDCIASGTILQPEKYMILPNRNDMKWTRIGKAVHHRNQKHMFERVGIMLQGKHSFCTKLASIIKHGGGQVFKTLQWLVGSIDEERTLVGAIVVEDKATVSRHLKCCALERDIPMMPSSWIIKTLYSGKLLPFTEENDRSPLPFVEVPEVSSFVDMSEEI